MSVPATGRSGAPLFAVAAFWAFVLGGIVFGAVFVVNWRAIGARTAERPGVAQTMVKVGAGPVSVTVPVGVTSSAPLAAVPKPVEITSSFANVVKNVLPDWQGTERVNILLLGIDKRDDEPITGTRSDTIMLASIDPVSKSAALVSIPRDLWVTIPGCTSAAGCIGGQQRINVAHAVGGPDMSRSTITADFGVPIQYYARVDFRGFEQLVDAAGGVVIDVDWPVKDDEYPTADYGYQRIYFAPGPQLLDGASALQYARSRHGMSDFARAGRQQKVLVSLRSRALQMNMLAHAPEHIGIIQKSLSTDLSPVQMLSLGKLISQIDRDKITNLVIDTNYVTPFKGQDGADLLRPNTPAIRAAIAATQRSAAHPELRAKIEVLNGSGTVGLGQKAADYLTAQGYNVVRIAAADRTDYGSSLVQVLSADRRAAEALATTLQVPATAISDVPTPNAAADVRVVLGQDFHLPPPTS
ncbi:MAG TPA: LCP family protein [Chloroflexota bacterium]|jgi:LCP family protein required for cell wall assembly|nr:LCP family protein [Chloroflexota bacterium]